MKLNAQHEANLQQQATTRQTTTTTYAVMFEQDFSECYKETRFRNCLASFY